MGSSGLEPPTSCLSGTRSNLLSYEPRSFSVPPLAPRSSAARSSDSLLALPHAASLRFGTSVPFGDDGIPSRRASARVSSALTVRRTVLHSRLVRIPSSARDPPGPLVEMMGFLRGARAPWSSSALTVRRTVLHSRLVRIPSSARDPEGPLVEMMGFEPMTPCLQGRCSPI